MDFPGKLTIEHFKWHKENGHKALIYQGRIYDVEEVLNAYRSEKPGPVKSKPQENIEPVGQESDGRDGDKPESSGKTRKSKPSEGYDSN